MIDTLTHRHADNDGVKIHYMAGGSGPLAVFIHGFPDFWYTWRHQIEGLSGSFAIAAMDTRGYNLSDAPSDVDDYAMEHLIEDVAAVITNEGRESAVIIGHDWGGATAWAFAQERPKMTDRLVIVNVPHPAAIATEMQRPGTAQPAAFAYASGFAEPGSEDGLSADALAEFMARDEQGRVRYREAFERSSFRSMMHYYRQNSKRSVDAATVIDVPVLQFHGLNDPALLADSLNTTWMYLANTWTLVTIPGAGHWPHHDQPELVTDTMLTWLTRPAPTIATAPDTPLPGQGARIEPADGSFDCCGTAEPAPPGDATVCCA